MAARELTGDVAVIGGGRMGEAIVRGLAVSGAVDRERIIVSEPDEKRREELAAAHDIRVTGDSKVAVASASVIILAVKPQVIVAVASAVAEAVPADAVVVSIAVGVSTATLEVSLPANTVVVRVMPNTPAMVGCGMSVVSGGSLASAEDVGLVRDLFASLGDAIVLPESQQDAAAAISGSGPAYMALVVDSLARAGVRQGLSRDIAQRLAVQTMQGTAELLNESGMHPESLVDGVTSPGGTTIAAIEVLEARGVRAAFMGAVDAAVKRAKELG